MGGRLSTHNNKKRVSSRFQTPSIKKSVVNQSIPQTSSSITVAPSISSQSSDGIIRNGRKYHSEISSTYWFPNDDEEIDRLVGQHFALKALFQGNIPQEALDEVPFENGAKILDLGCGPGTWIMDVATEFPSSEFIGLDMSDIFPNNIRPANVDFIVGNVLEGLDFEDNTFDVVNICLFILAFKSDQWVPVLKEIKRVLKPGGFILSKEAGMLEIGNDFVKWAGKVFKDTMVKRGQEPYIIDKMVEHMEEAGFDIVHKIKKEIYPGKPDQLSREFLSDLHSIFKTAQPFLSEQLEISDDKYPAFLEQFVNELQQDPPSQWSMASTMGRKPF